MLTGVSAADETTASNQMQRPPFGRMYRTETWLLPAISGEEEVAIRRALERAGGPDRAPVPAPPALNGLPAIGVSEPSA